LVKRYPKMPVNAMDGISFAVTIGVRGFYRRAID
jgi:hypothetical protein